MATPQAIVDGATCFTCIPDKLSALLYLLANNAGVTDLQTIIDGARCYSCIPDKWAAILYLLDNGGGGGGGGASGNIVALTGANVPVAAPASGSGVAYNEVPNFWVWNTTTLAWDNIV